MGLVGLEMFLQIGKTSDFSKLDLPCRFILFLQNSFIQVNFKSELNMLFSLNYLQNSM